jgi:hypothetical protein
MSLSGAQIHNTPAATTFLGTCSAGGSGPVYPPKFTWDLMAYHRNAPIPATAAMGLPPKVEQWRDLGAGLVLIATYSKLSSDKVCNVPTRADNPTGGAPATTVDALGCGGPLAGATGSYAPYSAIKPGDVLKVYASVYPESVPIYPTLKTTVAAVTTVAGSTLATTPNSVAALDPDDAFYNQGQTQFAGKTHVVSVDNTTTPKQIVMDKPAAASGTVTAGISRPIRLTIQGVVQNVPGYGNVRPSIRWNDYSDHFWGTPHGMIMLGSGGTWGDVRSITIQDIDLIVDDPPFGQQGIYSGNLNSNPFGMIYMGPAEMQGDAPIPEHEI